MGATPKIRRTFASALALGVLALAAAPARADVTVSQTGGVGGTLTVIGDATGDGIRIAYEPSDDCPVTGRACDVVLAGTGSGWTQIHAGPGCWTRAYADWGIICPDSGRFAVDMGAGDDSVEMYSNLAYDEAVVHGGPGDDWLEGDITSKVANRDVLYGDDGNDRLLGYAGDDELHGGPGADTIGGGEGSDVVLGEDGNDPELNGGAGNDTVDGGAGDDTLGGILSFTGPPDTGADAVIGGAGHDTMSYSARTEPVSVTLDGLPNDGVTGEGDNVHGDVETVRGTSSGDTLIGSDQADELDGEGGNDVIDGRGGNDIVSGGSDNDTLVGGPGQDKVNGDAGACYIGAGDCPSGDDTIDTRDGEQDSLDCGPGSGDKASADRVDVVPTTGWATCEIIKWAGHEPAAADQDGDGVPDARDSCPTQAASTANGCPAGGYALGITLAGTRLRLTGRSSVTVRLSIPGEDRPCTGTLTLRTAKRVTVARKAIVTLGTARFTTRPGATTTVRIKLGRRARRVVRRARRLAVRLTATATDSAGRKGNATKVMTLGS